MSQVKLPFGVTPRMHFEHVLEATQAMLAQLKKEIEDVRAKGGYPHDYSLGFTNAIIKLEHALACRTGQPEFYTQKTSIGETPRPVVFKEDIEHDKEADLEHEMLVDNILLRVEKLVGVFKTYNDSEPLPIIFFSSLQDLSEAQDNLNKFFEEKECQDSAKTQEKSIDCKTDSLAPSAEQPHA